MNRLSAADLWRLSELFGVTLDGFFMEANRADRLPQRQEDFLKLLHQFRKADPMKRTAMLVLLGQ